MRAGSLRGRPRRSETELRRRKQLGELADTGPGTETLDDLSHAVILGKLQANPVAAIRKPAQGRKRAVRPLAPAAVERLRQEMPTERDATLVSVLAYAGLRPGEALALTWEQVGERTILVERSLALGEVKETKTRRPAPSVCSHCCGAI